MDITNSPSTIVTVLPSTDFGPVLNRLAIWFADSYPYWLVNLGQVTNILIILSIILSVFLLFGIIYCVEQLKIIRRKEHDLYDLKVEDAYETTDKADATLSKRWENVMRNIESTNQSDWRQAIMEADIILDDLLNRMEYHGESVLEKN